MIETLVIYLLTVAFSYLSVREYSKRKGIEPSMADVFAVFCPILNILVGMIALFTSREDDTARKIFLLKNKDKKQNEDIHN